MVYSFDSFNLNISEFTKPSINPGRNSQILLLEQFYSISREPTIIAPKYTPYIFIFCPRVISQNMAKSRPPDPFHPRYMLLTTATNDTMHSNFSLLSSAELGRQGYSSYLRIMPMQLIRKADRQVTNAYWRTGIPARSEIQKCIMTSRGPRMRIMGLLSLILGSSAFYLYQNYCRSA